MRIITKSCAKQAFRRVFTPVSCANLTSRPFSSFVTGRQPGGTLAVSIPTRTYTPALTKQTRVTMVFQRWYSVSQLQEDVRSVHPLSTTENLFTDLLLKYPIVSGVPRIFRRNDGHSSQRTRGARGLRSRSKLRSGVLCEF